MVAEDSGILGSSYWERQPLTGVATTRTPFLCTGLTHFELYFNRKADGHVDTPSPGGPGAGL